MFLLVMTVNVVIGEFMIVCMSKMYMFTFDNHVQPAWVSEVYDSWHESYTSLALQLAPSRLPSPPLGPPFLVPLSSPASHYSLRASLQSLAGRSAHVLTCAFMPVKRLPCEYSAATDIKHCSVFDVCIGCHGWDSQMHMCRIVTQMRTSDQHCKPGVLMGKKTRSLLTCSRGPTHCNKPLLPNKTS